MTLSEWQVEIHKCAVGHGFYEGGDRNILELLMLAVTELAEAAEEVRAGVRLDWVRRSITNKPEGFPVEIADCIIRLLDMCEYLGVDMEVVMEEKHRYNQTRPYRHGGKTA